MKINHEKYQKVINGFFLFFVFTVVFFTIFGNITFPKLSTGMEDGRKDYTGQWYLIGEDGSRKEVEIPGRIEGVKIGEEITIATTLPEDVEDNKYLTFLSGKQDMYFYIDGEYRGTYSAPEGKVFGRATAVGFYFLKLQQEDSGKELQITMSTEAKSYTGKIVDVYYGSQMELFYDQFQADVLKLAVAFAIIVLCVITIVVGIGFNIMYKSNVEIVYLAVGIGFASVWVIANSQMRQFIFPNLSVMNDVAFIMILLMPPFFLSYINSTQKYRYGRFHNIMQTIACANFIICSLLHDFKVSDYTDLMPIIGGVSLAIIACLVTTVIIDLIKGNAKEYMMVGWGTIALMFAGSIEIVAYFDTAFYSGGVSLEIGMIVMLVCAMINAVNRISKSTREKQEAIAAKEMRGRFLANMSHEIRTPINSVLGFNTMILRESEDEAVLKYASDIQSAGQSLLSIVNDVLDFSKIESGKMEIMDEEYDLGELIHDVYSMISIKAMNKDLKLIHSVDESLPVKLYGDDVRIKQVLVNLLNNAVKYTDQGSVTLGISGSRDGEYELLRFSVADTGVGIAPEDIEKLFAEYGRIENESNHHKEGTGLGMSISTSILSLMNSELKVDSKVGEGSDFHFEIRQKIVDDTPLGNIEKHLSKGAAKKGYKSKHIAPKANVLVVDDNDMNRSVFKSLLKQTKVQIDEADNGNKCLEALLYKRYDLIFLDYMMPGLSGYETLMKMKEIPDSLNEGVPVIVLTANATAGIKEQYLSEGFDDYLSKPIDADKLEDMIWQYLPEEVIEEPGTEEAVIEIKGKRQEETKPKKSYKEEFKDELADLPQIDGIRWNVAYETFKDKEILLAAATEFGRSSEAMADKLTEACESLRRSSEEAREEAFKAYRIQAHAMKGNAATVGALALSDIAKSLEYAARDGKYDVIDRLNDIFLDMWKDKGKAVKEYTDSIN